MVSPESIVPVIKFGANLTNSIATGDKAPCATKIKDFLITVCKQYCNCSA
ncbi:hypothetical protein AAFM79_21915 [Trichormus azollae HNT15244]